MSDPIKTDLLALVATQRARIAELEAQLSKANESYQIEHGVLKLTLEGVDILKRQLAEARKDSDNPIGNDISTDTEAVANGPQDWPTLRAHALRLALAFREVRDEWLPAATRRAIEAERQLVEARKDGEHMRAAMRDIDAEIAKLFWTSDDGEAVREGDPEDAEAPTEFCVAWSNLRELIDQARKEQE